MSEKKSKLELLQEKFKDIKKAAEVDASFDKERMETQFNNTLAICKWLNKKTEWSELFRVYDYKRKEMYKKLYTFYKIESDLKITTKDELDLFITADSQYTELYMITLTVKEIMGYIDSTIENLKGKNFEIQRYIQWQQFINGK